MQPADLGHLLIAEPLIPQGATVLLEVDCILISLDIAVQQEAFRYLSLVVSQYESDNRQFMKRPPSGLGTGRVTGPEQGLHLGRHEAGTGVKQRERRAPEIVAIGSLALVRMEILACLQAADTHAFIEIQSAAPPLLKALLEAAPDVPVLPKHARSIRLQALGNDIGSSLRGCVKRFGDPVLIGPPPGRLGDHLIEQFGEGLPRTDTLLVGRIATTTPDMAETLGRTQIRRPDIHLRPISPIPAC